MKSVGLIFHLCLLLVLGLHKQAQAEQGQPQSKDSVTSSIGFSADIKKQILPYVERWREKIATQCNGQLYYHSISYSAGENSGAVVIDKKEKNSLSKYLISIPGKTITISPNVPVTRDGFVELVESLHELIRKNQSGHFVISLQNEQGAITLLLMADQIKGYTCTSPSTKKDK